MNKHWRINIIEVRIWSIPSQLMLRHRFIWTWTTKFRSDRRMSQKETKDIWHIMSCEAHNKLVSLFPECQRECRSLSLRCNSCWIILKSSLLDWLQKKQGNTSLDEHNSVNFPYQRSHLTLLLAIRGTRLRQASSMSSVSLHLGFPHLRSSWHGCLLPPCN